MQANVFLQTAEGFTQQHTDLSASQLHVYTCAGLFSGGVLYVSAIELPAALKYSYSCFSNYFSDMYPRCGRWVHAVTYVQTRSKTPLCIEQRREDRVYRATQAYWWYCSTVAVHCLSRCLNGLCRTLLVPEHIVVNALHAALAF